jgi:ribonuclease BN (tRNA processing enzyme)
VKLTLIPTSSVPGPQYLTGALVNDTLALDAGPLGLYGTPDDQARVHHVLLSHSHTDHLATLPIFLENAFRGGPDCVTVHASRAVLDCLQRDVFNGRLWADFIALSREGPPFVKVSPLEPGQTVDLDGVRVTAVALDHTVPTAGYLLADGTATVAWATDTGPTEEIWRRCNASPDLSAVFLEAAFPDHMGELAALTKHLTPRTFARELAKLHRPVRVIVVHIKARFQAQVLAELAALGLAQVEVARFGVPYVFP